MKAEASELRWAGGGLVFLLAVAATAMQNHGGRYDFQIRAELKQVLDHNNAYHNVTAMVEDGVVVLAGSVELDSTRQALFARVRRIPHVESVEANVVLSPPAVPDQTLYGRVQQTLSDAGFAEVKFRAHEGAVILEGTVRNLKQRQRLIELIQATDGVKEVSAIALIAAE
ncbi:MAG TPA: BON domain-containing protein [Terriglobales bacterium]|nr:BON domain-containing protein [Terriglobales bacterium]